MNVMEELSKLTYALQHNPNCTSPYLVRLIAPGGGTLDFLPNGQTKDILGYGGSTKIAAEVALKKFNEAHATRIPGTEKEILAHAHCKNCAWTWSGDKDLFGKGDGVLAAALIRAHIEGQAGPINDPGCRHENIVITYSNKRKRKSGSKKVQRPK